VLMTFSVLDRASYSVSGTTLAAKRRCVRLCAAKSRQRTCLVRHIWLGVANHCTPCICILNEVCQSFREQYLPSISYPQLQSANMCFRSA
jgi:hypothetical protein